MRKPELLTLPLQNCLTIVLTSIPTFRSRFGSHTEVRYYPGSIAAREPYTLDIISEDKNAPVTTQDHLNLLQHKIKDGRLALKRSYRQKGLKALSKSEDGEGAIETSPAIKKRKTSATRAKSVSEGKAKAQSVDDDLHNEVDAATSDFESDESVKNEMLFSQIEALIEEESTHLDSRSAEDLWEALTVLTPANEAHFQTQVKKKARAPEGLDVKRASVRRDNPNQGLHLIASVGRLYVGSRHRGRGPSPPEHQIRGLSVHPAPLTAFTGFSHAVRNADTQQHCRHPSVGIAGLGSLEARLEAAKQC